MKKLFTVLLISLLSLSLVACGDNEEEVTKNENETETEKEDNQTTTIEYEMQIEEVEGGKTYTFSRMLTSLEDIQMLDISDEYESVCAIIFTLAMYESDPNVCKEMLEYINGPEDVSDFDINFIDNQIEQYPYVMRSYFNGTSPENNYEVDEVSITIKENTYSRDEDGYVKLWLTSSGADSERSVMVRQKGSTGEWFLFSDSYKGLMAGIRMPAKDDKWA